MTLLMLPVKLALVAVRLVALPFEIAFKILVGRKRRRRMGAAIAAGAIVATAAAVASAPPAAR